jgi:hypothetical protein
VQYNSQANNADDTGVFGDWQGVLHDLQPESDNNDVDEIPVLRAPRQPGPQSWAIGAVNAPLEKPAPLVPDPPAAGVYSMSDKQPNRRRFVAFSEC